MTNELRPADPADEPKTTKLKQLALKANEAHGQVVEAARFALLHAYQAGVALVQARNLCEPRGWLAWLALHFKSSARTAQRYMEFALDCHRLGGLDAERVSHLPPDEANRKLSRLLAVRDARKKARAAAHPTNALPAPAATPARAAPEPAASGDAAANPYRRFRQLLEELMEGLRAVMNGDDCHDGPFAELLLIDLKPVHADLLEYLQDRDRLRR